MKLNDFLCALDFEKYSYIGYIVDNLKGDKIRIAPYQFGNFDDVRPFSLGCDKYIDKENEVEQVIVFQDGSMDIHIVGRII